MLKVQLPRSVGDEDEAVSMSLFGITVVTRRILLFVSLIIGVAIAFHAFHQVALAAPPAVSPEEGQVLFSQRCVSCHTVGAGVKIGPDLKGVTERREEAWLTTQILAPSQHDENDPISVANREQYGLQMPDLTLTEQQVGDVIAYLKTATTAPTVIPVLYAPTLAAGVLVIIVLTLLGLRFGTKKVEVRP
jgi:mono/diheme cytochrome c family protein